MVFLGCLFDRNDEYDLLNNSNCGISNAVNTFQWELINGLNSNLNKPVNIINVLPVGTYPKQYKKIILKTKEWSYNGADSIELGCVNLPFIKQYQRYIKCKMMLKNNSLNDKNIIIYSTYLPFLKSIYKLNSSYNITLVVTDLPEYYDLNKVSSIKKWLRKLSNKKIYKYLKRIDKFVLLTEQMKEPLKIGHRPYVVIEGICSSNKNDNIVRKNSDKKIILYTGTLHYQFGIKNLLDAFNMINNDNYELWICGSGEAQQEIVNISQNNNKVKFYGYVTKDDIYIMQQKATILINPRTNDGEYTKYSFPSKTMEYMLSGIPVVMYKLDGIPNDYDDYIYYVEDNSVETLKNKIIEVCEKPLEELNEFGEKAKEFVLSEKNNVVQAEKVIRLIT